MIFVVSVCLLSVLLTVGTAWFTLARWPSIGTAGHVMLAAASFPAAATVIAAGLVVWTIFQRAKPADEGPLGMIIFAFLMFWIVAVAIGAVIGVPTAIVAVRALKS